jgi:3-dehydrocarnitine:acetyl-CoA trimethylamine transferase
MNYEVVLTCAVTGGSDTKGKHPGLPASPAEIAAASIDAAKAGAAITHIHVREPETGAPSRELALYKETAKLIRESDVDVILNITTGMGGDLIPSEDDPSVGGPGTDMITPEERVRHIEIIKPEICSLDCGSFNYAQTAYVATMDMLRESAARIQKAGVTPEIEVFELGHIWQAKQLIKEGLISKNALFQLCMGIPFGAEGTTRNVVTMLEALPAGVAWGAFALGRDEMPMLAQSVIMGGNARVGLEDNLYLEKGVLASNAQLVQKGKEIIERLGGRLLSPAEARKKLNLS